MTTLRIAAVTVLVTLIAGIATAQDQPKPTSPEAKKEAKIKVLKVLDDFETGVDAWQPNGSGDLTAAIEAVEGAKAGKKAAKIAFGGKKSDGSWMNMVMSVEELPKEEVDQLSFWAKAEKECSVKVAVFEGGWPKLEIFTKTLTLGTEWKQYTIAIKDINELAFAHEQGENKFEPEKMNKFGFRPVDVPATITIDQIQLEHLEDDEAAHSPHGKPKSYKPEQLIDSRPVDEKAFPFVVEDFEGEHLKKWRKQDSGYLKSTVEFVNDAKVGKKAGKIGFSGEQKKGSWTDLFYYVGIGKWPAGGNVLTFWAKAEKECKIRVKINQGAQHDEWEFYSTKPIEIGTEWKKCTIPLAEINNCDWGHIDPPSGKVLPHLVYGLGFREEDFPAAFSIDQIQIERDPAVK